MYKFPPTTYKSVFEFSIEGPRPLQTINICISFLHYFYLFILFDAQILHMPDTILRLF